MIIIGDIHGNYDTLIALLNMIPKDEEILLCGDLIDRGPKSCQVVQWCIDNNINSVTGNHEEMMVDWSINKDFKNDLWLQNGGQETLDSYLLSNGSMDWKLFDEHCEWMSNLPVYIEDKLVKNDEGRHLVVSHSNVGNVWHIRSPDSNLYLRNFRSNVAWSRPKTIKDIPNVYNVIGHTPQPYGARIRKPFANIDTGCCYPVAGYGKLTALQFPKMILYSHQNIDGDNYTSNPITSILTVEENETRLNEINKRIK